MTILTIYVENEHTKRQLKIKTIYYSTVSTNYQQNKYKNTPNIMRILTFCKHKRINKKIWREKFVKN